MSGVSAIALASSFLFYAIGLNFVGGAILLVLAGLLAYAHKMA